MPGRRYVEEIGSAAMLATSRCRTRGESPGCVTHTPLPRMNKDAHPAFETQWRHHQKSETGVSVAPQKGLTSSKKFCFLKK